MKKVILLVLLALGINQASATMISHAGYSHDDTTNIVVGGGLEWLQWDETVGKSINEALAANPGWALATNTQMAALFNAFGFGAAFTWDADENTSQTQSTGSDAIESPTDSERLFVQIFGNTATLYPADPANPLERAAAFFGEDADNDTFYNEAIVFDDYAELNAQVTDGAARLFADINTATATYTYEYTGVALVRNPTQAPVPEPTILALMGLGLAGIGFRRYRSKKAA